MRYLNLISMVIVLVGTVIMGYSISPYESPQVAAVEDIKYGGIKIGNLDFNGSGNIKINKNNLHLVTYNKNLAQIGFKLFLFGSFIQIYCEIKNLTNNKLSFYLNKLNFLKRKNKIKN